MTAAATASARPGLGPWVVPLLALMVFVNYIDRGNLATAAPLIKDELSLTSTQVGLLVSAFFWTYTPGQLVAGWLAERLNAYRTLAAGLALWSLATFFTGFASGFAAILLLRLLLGLGEAAAVPCASKLIAQHVPQARLGATNGLVAQGTSLGPAVGVFFGGLMMASLGWREVFLLFGAVSILWLVPWFFATRRLSAEAHTLQEGEAPSYWTILKRREMWGAALGHVCGNYGFYFLISWMPLYLVKARGFSVGEMATIGGVVYLAFGAGALAGCLVTDAWIAAGATANRARKTAFVVANGAAVAAFLACAYGTTPVALASLVVAGAAFGLGSPHTFAAAQTMAGPRAAGKWVGLQNCIGNISGIVSPIVTGALIDATGGYGVAFMVAAAVTVVAIVGWVVVVPKIAPLAWD
jgi:MFS family permease